MSDDLDRKVRDVKATYGENHWWESGDKRTLGYYQVMESTLIIDFAQFHEALEELLGRGVQTFEMATFNIARLRAEAQAAWEGRPYSDEERDAAASAAIDRLIEKMGVDQVIIVPVDEDEDEEE